MVENFSTQSGDERINSVLTQALNLNPNVLLLDEPTNHLDQPHRRHLLHWLSRFPDTLLAVSHDMGLLRRPYEQKLATPFTNHEQLDQAHLSHDLKPNIIKPHGKLP